MSDLEYTIGDELGDAGLFLYDTNGALVDFATGWTFSLKIYDTAGTAFFTKTTGITGAAGSLTSTPKVPNVAVAWATTGELNLITVAGKYPLRLTATRASDSKTRTGRYTLEILPLI